MVDCPKGFKQKGDVCISDNSTKSLFKGGDIKRTTAIVSMIILGAIAIIYSIRGFIVDLTPSVFGIVGLGIGAILVSEIGIKRLTKLSNLKRLENQQYISLTIAVVVIITSIGLLFGYEIPILATIANGSFLTGGVLTILEASTF